MLAHSYSKTVTSVLMCYNV